MDCSRDLIRLSPLRQVRVCTFGMRQVRVCTFGYRVRVVLAIGRSGAGRSSGAAASICGIFLI